MAFFCCAGKCKIWARKTLSEILFNSLLTFIDGTFLFIVMAAALNIKLVADGKLTANFSFFFSLFGLLICFVELVAIAVFLKINFASLNEDRRRNRCGYIYEGLNYVKKGGKALLYPVLY